MTCPHHKDIQFCPLYLASHYGGLGCDDGHLEHGECAVRRGMDYAAERARAAGARDDLRREFALLAFREEAEAGAAQRRRNMHFNGIH